MVKYNYFYFIFFCLLGITTYAQKVSNITFRQEQSNIVVSYDLETKTPCKVSLYVSNDGGTSWQGPLKKVTGNVVAKIASGSHSITWNVLEEFEELRGNKIMFQVRVFRDNNETVIIGTQEWTTKNLNVSKYRNGDIIPEVKDPEKWGNLKTGAWCYYNNDPKNGAMYGKLYNWYAVNDPRGLAPEGFHIPSDSELSIVTDFNNINGFEGLPGGCCDYGGTFTSIGSSCYLWSSIENSSPYAWFFNIDFNSGIAIRDANDKTYGLSVRCVRD